MSRCIEMFGIELQVCSIEHTEIMFNLVRWDNTACPLCKAEEALKTTRIRIQDLEEVLAKAEGKGERCPG